jgi:hypothetical protein
MHRTIQLLILLALAALLAACKGSATPTATGAPSAGQPDVNQRGLIMGSLALRDDALAVDAQQAATLLPLWKAYRTLSQSETATPLERQGVLRQIREQMRPEQLAAMDALTVEDQARLAAELGLPWASQEAQSVSPDVVATRMAEVASNPAAHPGAGGGMMQGLGGGGLAAGTGAGVPAEGGVMIVRGQGSNMQDRATVALLEALIEHLEAIR